MRTSPRSPRRLTALVLAGGAVAVALGCSGGDDGVAGAPSSTTATSAHEGATCTADTVTTTRDIAYREIDGVDADLLSLDLSVPDLPDGCPDPPVVVWVHGGGFAAGDRRHHVADKVALAASHGWALASVSYRLSPGGGEPQADAVRHPDHVEDVAAALAWVRDHGVDGGVDGTRIGLMGHSAGAFLVSLVATDARFLTATGGGLDDIACAISLDTTYDIVESVAADARSERMFRAAFGDDPQVWRAASPVIAAEAGGAPPFLVVTRGGASRIASSQALVDALRAAGGSAELLDANPSSHADVNQRIGTPGDDVVTPAVEAFLTDCLAA